MDAANRLLTAPDAGDILRAALGTAQAELLSWRAEQVDYQPRRGSTAGYRVRVRWPDRRVTEERFGAHTGGPPADLAAAPGVLTVGDGADRVAVWRFPHDPYLPGLAAAYDPAAVAGLLASFGLGGGGPVTLALRAYRPRRRAVVEASGPGGRLFLKVVRPDRVAGLHRRHRLVTGAGVPAPASLGYTPDGLLVLAALPGQPLRQALRQRGAPLPPGAAVLRLLDRLPPELAEQRPGRRSWRDRAGHYAEVVAGVLPPQADRVRQLATEITGQSGTGPLVPVHGDLYEAQLRVAGGRITGVLDLDTAGPGERLDDLACLLGHLSVLAQLDPARAAATNRLGAGYLAGFERTVDPADLRSRVAAVVLSLATGPHRVQERGWRRATRCRVDLAERWLSSARNLRRLSPWPQGQLMPVLDAGGRQPAGPGGVH